MQKFNLSLLRSKKIKIIIGLFTVLLGIFLFMLIRENYKTITKTKVDELYKQNKIKKITLHDKYFYIQTKEEYYKIYKNAIDKQLFFNKYIIEVEEDSDWIYDLFSLFIILIIFLFFYKFIMQSRLEQLKTIKAYSKDEKDEESIEAINSNITFANVAGIKDVKEELEEIIDFLKEPQKYRELDIRLPKGVLLVGPPGVGKTLISKAVAGEADVPFFYQSGASFVHIYVGMGAKRVSALFKRAKQIAPSIIFIDEIDAVGKSRGEFRNDEREATLNQLLTEMDGFEDSSGVIVIGATNKIEMLDEALLRAGRFDRQIHIPLPDLEDRITTLELYLSKKPHRVDIEKIARMSVGFNSAGLDTLTNEATIYAMRDGRKIVDSSDFEAVKEKVLMGKRKIFSLTHEERKIQAIYQSGKAVIASWLDIEFDRVGIVNREFIIQEREILSRSQLLARAKVYLAGSISTKIEFNEQFTNASVDISKAKIIVQKVIYQYGMSDRFIVTPQQEEELLQELVLETDKLLKSLYRARVEIEKYLLKYENITCKKSKEIVRELF